MKMCTEVLASLQKTESLSCLYDLAGVRAFKYREWADRFRTYDLNMSALFEMLADGEDEKEFYLSILNNHVVLKSGFSLPSQPLKYFDQQFPLEEHFLVLSPNVAGKLLVQAVEMEKVSLEFYRQVRLILLSEHINLLESFIARCAENIFTLQRASPLDNIWWKPSQADICSHI
jgi:hypothetical protein